MKLFAFVKREELESLYKCLTQTLPDYDSFKGELLTAVPSFAQWDAYVQVLIDANDYFMLMDKFK